MTMKDKIKDQSEHPERATRMVRMSPELMDQFATRTTDGKLVLWNWGEPDEDGFYTPTATVVGDDQLLSTPGGVGATKDTADEE